MYPGRRPLEATIFENAWQYMKLYSARADEAGMPTPSHARWMLEGIGAADPRRFPMGRGAKPLCSVWRNRLLGYVEARIRIYVSLYVEAICRNANAREAYQSLRAVYARVSAAGGELALYDYDGYDHVKAGASLAAVMSNPNRKMGHAFVLACLLEGILPEVVREAAELASIGPLTARDLPADIAPLRETELLAAVDGSELVGGAVVYHRPEFLNNMADRYFALFQPGGAAKIPWERRGLTMYGKECKEGHDTAFFGDAGTSYRYTGKDHAPLPWETDPTGALRELLEIVRLVDGQPYNFCLMNLYGPEDSIGRHSDDERDLVPGSSIFSVSLGRARLFEMEPRLNGGGLKRAAVRVRLAHGSAIVMAGLTQRAYKHFVDPEKMRASKAGGPTVRVNLTFRCVVPR